MRYSRCGMVVKPCGESNFLEKDVADCLGCMTIADYERPIGKKEDCDMTELEKLEAGLEYCYDDRKWRLARRMLSFSARNIMP